MKYLKTVILFFILFMGVKTNAQPLPLDPQIKIGKLDNGMTYYIRNNKEPKERASFYIIQNVGSVLENDDQDGLAHFLEHMAFNGTKNFPGKGVLNTLQKSGIEFGRNINAYTSFEETVYNISDVPIKNPGLLDTCILILHDWADGLTLSDAEIDSERGVITEEWRTRREANWRLREQYFPTLLNNSKHSQRDIIGKLDIIKNFKPQTIKDFYHDWYRTDLQAIAIVGDIDVNEVEAKIKATLGKIKAIDNPKPRQTYEIPYHEGTKYVLATDKEAPAHSISIYHKHKDDISNANDATYYRNNLISTLFNRMLGERINELVQKGNPPFIGGGVSYGGFLRGYNNFTISASAHPNKMDIGLKAIYTEAVRVKKHGFTTGEIERAKANILSQLETRVKQKDKIRNDQYCRNIVDHYLENNSLLDIEVDLQLKQMLFPTITAEEVSAKINDWMIMNNRVIVVQGPTGEDVKLLSEAEVNSIMAEVEKSNIEPYKEEAVATSLISKEIKGGKIVSTKKLPQFDAVEWTLSNKAKVIYKKADFQKDNVMIRGISPGGSSLYGTDILPSISMMPAFMSAFGVGDFDATALKKTMTGKNVTIAPSISNLSESIGGNSTPKDLESAFQLTYLYFVQPRFEADAFKALQTRYLAFIENMNKNPQKVMSDSTEMITSNYSPRTVLMNKETLQNISVTDMEKVYKERMKDAGDFTFFVVGNVEEKDLKPFVEKYLASIPDDPRVETWKDNKVRMPKGKTIKEILIPLETEKANIMINMQSPVPYNTKNIIYHDLLKGILDLRFTEDIREKEGGTYGVAVYGGSSKRPQPQSTMIITFDTDVPKAAHLKGVVYTVLDKLKKDGPSATDLDKAVKNLLKNREQEKPNNSYWMNTLINFYQNGIDSNDPKNYENILNKVKPADIKKYANLFFGKADSVDLTFKPTPKGEKK